jgi:hypothetical protein
MTLFSPSCFCLLIFLLLPGSAERSIQQDQRSQLDLRHFNFDQSRHCVQIMMRSSKVDIT